MPVLLLHMARVAIRAFVPLLVQLQLSTTLAGTKPSIAELRRIAAAHLRVDDLRLFELVTGNSVAALLHHPSWDATPSHAMKKIMGINKIVAHQLNGHGLHVLRPRVAMLVCGPGAH